MVVEIPRPLWWLILTVRAAHASEAKSAERYAAIWMKEGSPLNTHGKTGYAAARLSRRAHQHPMVVDYAMRYGNPPSIPPSCGN
jgi:protoporphyrin/coproporphyrin ferrochelatase